MGRLFCDTAPEIETFYIEKMRDVPGWRKLEMVEELNAAVRGLALNGLRARYPDQSHGELRRKLAEILVGVETVQIVYESCADRRDMIAAHIVDSNA